MPRFSVTLDPELLKAALEAAGGRLRRRQVIELALKEFIARRRQARLRELVGSGLVEMTLEELAAWRRSALERP